MNPQNLPTAGQWFSENIGLLIGLIIGITALIFLVWSFLDKEKKTGFWTKFLTSLTAGFFLTVIYFVYKFLSLALEKI